MEQSRNGNGEKIPIDRVDLMDRGNAFQFLVVNGIVSAEGHYTSRTGGDTFHDWPGVDNSTEDQTGTQEV